MKRVVKVYKTLDSEKKGFKDLIKDLSQMSHKLVIYDNERRIEVNDETLFTFACEERGMGEKLRGCQFDVIILNETVDEYMLNSILIPTPIATGGKII